MNFIFRKKNKRNVWLDYRKNVYSQNGEDGILSEIFKQLNIDVKWVCEFGAADGKFCSNTFQFVERGSNAIYIEADDGLYVKLLETVKSYKNVTAINKLVSLEGTGTLDNILLRTPIPKNFDILSIDIDSFDYQVWKSFVKYTPKIVIIEINSDISPTVENHIHTPAKYQGTSFLPMLKLGVEKGYSLIAHTGNLIFIRDDLKHLLNHQLPEISSAFTSNWFYKND